MREFSLFPNTFTADEQLQVDELCTKYIVITPSERGIITDLYAYAVGAGNTLSLNAIKERAEEYNQEGIVDAFSILMDRKKYLDELFSLNELHKVVNGISSEDKIKLVEYLLVLVKMTTPVNMFLTCYLCPHRKACKLGTDICNVSFPDKLRYDVDMEDHVKNVMSNMKEGDIYSECPSPHLLLSESSRMDASFKLIIDMLTQRGFIVGLSEDKGVASDGDYINLLNKFNTKFRGRTSVPCKSMQRLLSSFSSFGGKVDDFLKLGDFLNIHSMQLFKLAGKYKEDFLSSEGGSTDTELHTDKFDVRQADLEGLPKITSGSKALFDVDEQIVLSESGSLFYEQKMENSKNKLFYLIIDVSFSMNKMFNSRFFGCTSASLLSSALCIGLLTEAQKKGVLFFRLFSSYVSQLYQCRTDLEYTFGKRVIALCDYNGDGTDLPIALERAIRDYEEADKVDDFSSAEVVIVTDGLSKPLKPEIVTKLKSFSDVHVILIATAPLKSYKTTEAFTTLRDHSTTFQMIDKNSTDLMSISKTIIGDKHGRA